ncbi:MAG: acyltransferase, partial [Candidatus Electrothrix sp. AR3]|nr:acyltransferase [Candidatus Electrothrix sp. AR3]
HYHCTITRIVSNKIIDPKYYTFTGEIGVSLFIILSGASLALSTRYNYSILNFYRKRFFAIFPLFWLTYLLAFIAKSIFFQSENFAEANPLTFILTIFGIDGFLFYKIPNYYLIGEWFLGCIIILYILFPLIRFFFEKNKLLLLLGSFIFCIVLQKIYSFDMLLMRFPLFRIFEFIFGMYWIATFNDRSHKFNKILLSSSVFVVLGIFLFNMYYNTLFVSNIVLGTLSFIILLSFVNIFEKNIPKKIFNFLSKYSYAAFLLHHVTIVATVTYFNNVVLFENYKYMILAFIILSTFSLSLITQHATIYLVQNIYKKMQNKSTT